MASGSGDGTIKIWELTTGECRGTLHGQHSGVEDRDVESLAALENGRLATGEKNGNITLWDSGLVDVLTDRQ